MHKHLRTHHKIVRHILRRIANQTHKLYIQIKKQFVIDKDIDVTMRFWQLLKEELPIHYFTEVSYCHHCKKFSLE